MLVAGLLHSSYWASWRIVCLHSMISIRRHCSSGWIEWNWSVCLKATRLVYGEFNGIIWLAQQPAALPSWLTPSSKSAFVESKKKSCPQEVSTLLGFFYSGIACCFRAHHVWICYRYRPMVGIDDKMLRQRALQVGIYHSTWHSWRTCCRRSQPMMFPFHSDDASLCIVGTTNWDLALP